jgi:hypothetical protein
MEASFDDTLPLPCEVEKEFNTKAGDKSNAQSWLAERNIKNAVLALIQYGVIWNSDTGRYRFSIYDPDHIGPKHPPELAIPIIEDGRFLDLLCISNEMTFERITCRAPWLGRENLAHPVVRLHAHPMDWLEAGCTGVCHIEPTSRKALKDLSGAVTIECSDIHTAMEAWDWGFDADRTNFDAPKDMARFSIDDSPFAIRQYFEGDVLWRTSYLRREAQE